MILGYIVRLKVKEIEIWNLSNVILSKIISLYTTSIAISIKQKKFAQWNNNYINREVFDYGYRDSTNGKSIINFMINKTEEKPRQAKKTSLILNNNTDTS